MQKRVYKLDKDLDSERVARTDKMSSVAGGAAHDWLDDDEDVEPMF